MARRPQLHHWFRLGYAIRGLVYMTLGMLAWQSGRGQSAHSTVEQLRDMPAGPLLLLAAAVGLTGLGLFRLGDALFDFDHRGDGWTKRLARLGRAGGGVGYLGLALLAARLLVGLQQSDGAMIDTARQVRGVPGGALL